MPTFDRITFEAQKAGLNPDNFQRGLTDQQRAEGRQRISDLDKQATMQRMQTENQSKIDNFNKGNSVDWGGIFGGMLNVVEVFAKKPEQPQQEEKPNYTPYLIGAAALLLVVILIKKK